MPAEFNFLNAVSGHGWYDLAPFEFDQENETLSYVFENPRTGRCESFTLTGIDDGVIVKVRSRSFTTDSERLIRHILRADEDLSAFYDVLLQQSAFEWVARMRAGRLLRSGTVFEDLVKSLCTTNCSWALTKIMTTNLVELLGKRSSDGRRAFPTARALAKMPESFFRNEIKAGYRSPYFVELAQAVAGGDIDPEEWLVSEKPTSELKKEIKQVKGIGDYAAENLLKLLGRYDGLALDSWLRSGFYKKHNRDKPCPDKKIEKHYRKFGEWKGLAIWCDMTQHWFEDGR